MRLINKQQARSHIKVGDLVKCKVTGKLYLVFFGDRCDDESKLYWIVRPETGKTLDGWYASILGVEQDFELFACSHELELHY